MANKLLRIIEAAFRNSNYLEQRLKAYDCWTEFIDNSSLNMEHMCNPKQIKLLVTPLKAKFSRNSLVITKRYNTFLHLIEKLQNNATLCLNEYLDFAFGPFGNKNEGDKSRPGKSISEVCSGNAKLLLEIIGKLLW